MKPRITLLWVHSTSLGYGRLGVYLAAGLTKAGVEVCDRLEDADAKTNVVCWVSTPSHARGWWAGQSPTIFTMWEASSLPPAFRENLHNFDTVIVPSDQNVELFSQYHPNVRKVQLGVDIDRWRFSERPEPATEFRFLCGGSGKRKGTDLAVKAFRKVFPDGSWGSDDPTPILVLKSPKPEDFYGPRIRRVPGRISDADEVDLYASAHCYLQPSRGEGFGLQPLQAIAQGCPTILTNAHGHRDFAHLGVPIGATLTHSDYFIFGDAGDWWEPDFDELCDSMRYVYDHYQQACAGARVSAELAAWHWGWEHTATQFVAAVGKDRLAAPYAGDGSWVEPTSKLYLVRTNQAWKADIAGRSCIFAPGVDYYEPADTKRILFEAGLLDPVCLAGPDAGLTAGQVERVGGYRADQSYCPTCLQKLGTGTTRADEIYAEMEAAAT